ncbi:hypothetical protein PAPYR_13186 [Paratrimastix pyriformis]|uniref:Uncharacterized protein n=1 Tax=Paratrimastix pyriformis TaxID=342808 RepID=A0ABQ8U0P3_9EUKA|nr:hypothetical protein PAPYR_13186 [Paratrimastix pyriformis]
MGLFKKLMAQTKEELTPSSSPGWKQLGLMPAHGRATRTVDPIVWRTVALLMGRTVSVLKQMPIIGRGLIRPLRMEQWTRAAAFYERVLQPITWAELSDPKSALYQSLEALFRVLVVDSARKSAKLHNLRRHFLQAHPQTDRECIAKREQIRQALQWAPAGLAETLSRFPHLAVLYGATEVKHRQLGSLEEEDRGGERRSEAGAHRRASARASAGSWQQGVMGSDHHYIMLDDPMMMALFDGSVFYLR